MSLSYLLGTHLVYFLKLEEGKKVKLISYNHKAF